MENPEPVPRPDLFTHRDAEAWDEQFHFLRYVLHMSPERIAQIDCGFMSDHPDAWCVFSWAGEIERQFPVFDARAAIMSAGKRKVTD